MEKCLQKVAHDERLQYTKNYWQQNMTTHFQVDKLKLFQQEYSNDNIYIAVNITRSLQICFTVL